MSSQLLNSCGILQLSGSEKFGGFRSRYFCIFWGSPVLGTFSAGNDAVFGEKYAFLVEKYAFLRQKQPWIRSFMSHLGRAFGWK